MAESHVRTVSSERLAELAGVNAAKVRKDLSYLGSYGTRGVGYDVEFLLFQMSRELGLTQDWPVMIVGIGNLGHALANYRGFDERGFPVAALVDADPAKVGERLGDLVVRHMDDVDEIVAELGIGIALIATPAAGAQEVADRLVQAGVRSILNFAPSVVAVPEGVSLRKVDLAVELQILSFYAQRRGGPRRTQRGRPYPGLSAARRAPVPGQPGPRAATVAWWWGVGGWRSERSQGLLAADALVTVVAPDVVDELDGLAGVDVERRPYEAGEVAGYRLAVTATDDPEVNRAGVPRRRGRRRLGQQRRRPGQLLVHPPRRGAPGTDHGDRGHRGPQPRAGHLAPPPHRAGARRQLHHAARPAGGAPGRDPGRGDGDRGTELASGPRRGDA